MQQDRGFVELIDDDILISVVIEITKSHSIGDAGDTKAPRGRSGLKGTVTTIPKGNIRSREGWVILSRPFSLLHGEVHCFESVVTILVHDVKTKSITDE